MSGCSDSNRSQMARPIPLLPPVTRIRFTAAVDDDDTDGADMATTTLGIRQMRSRRETEMYVVNGADGSVDLLVPRMWCCNNKVV